MTLLELRDAGCRRAARPDWPDGDYLDMPHRCGDGSFGENVVWVAGGERLPMTLADADDGADGWEDRSPPAEAPPPQDPGWVPLPFEEVRWFEMPFGQHMGLSLEEIAADDAGLLYLDGLVAKKWLWEWTRDIIRSYLADPAVARDLDRALGE